MPFYADLLQPAEQPPRPLRRRRPGHGQGSARRARRRLGSDDRSERLQLSALTHPAGGASPLRPFRLQTTWPERGVLIAETRYRIRGRPPRGLSDLAIRNLFIIPTIAFLIVFNIFPLIYSLGYSFTDFRASTNAPANFVGLRNYRELLTDPFIWNNFVVTAKYVIVSVGGQMHRRLRPGAAPQPRHPLQGPDHHAAAPADDDVDGGGRPVLEADLRSLLGAAQLHPRPRQFRLAVQPRRGALRHRHHRHLDVGALRDAAVARRPLGRAEASLRGGGDRPRRALVHLHPHHAAAGRADPDDRDHLPHHGGVQDLRPRLHHVEPADDRADLDPALQDGVPANGRPASRAPSPTSC